MRVSFRWRLFLGPALIVVAALAGLLLLEAHEQRRWLEERDRESLGRLARHLARELPAGLATGVDGQTLAAEFDSTLGVRVTLIDGTGRVVADSRVPREQLEALENHAGRPEVRDALAGRVGWAVRRSASIGVPLLYVAVPARPTVAVLRVARPLEDLARLDASLLRLSAAAAAVALLAVVVLLYWVSGLHAGRIRELEAVTARVGAGAADARAREQPDDSLGRLGRAINQMAAELRSRVEALERERDERESILAHMSDGVALIDGAGRLVHVNQSLASILGLPRPASPGTPFAEYLRSPELGSLLQAARDESRTVEADLRVWTPRPRQLRATVTPLGPAGDSLLLVLHDLTEVERMNRVRQDFVANVSHELRTPLTSLRGYAETLLEGGLEDAEHRVEFVRVMRDQAARLEALVEDLLSLAELERPGARLRIERSDLRALAERQVAATRAAAERAGLTLELVSGPPVPAEVDPALIEQVLANLLDNAVKYTERGGVRVALGSGPASVWLEVADTGPGIPLEDQPRVFERFYRVDKARSREKGGTGLGLSIVKHIAQLHGGEVSLESAPSRGSVFRVEIPRPKGGGGALA